MDFDNPDNSVSPPLQGGRAHSVTIAAHKAVTSRVRLGGTYGARRAKVGPAVGAEDFTIHDAQATVSYELSPTFRMEGGPGISHLALPAPIGNRTGPAGHVSLGKRTEHAWFMVSARRSFVPAYGFGGSIDNQEVMGTVRVPFARNRAYSSTSLAWRRTDTVFPGEVGVKSIWLHTTLGYSLPAMAPARGVLQRLVPGLDARGRPCRSEPDWRADCHRTPHEAAVMATFHPLDYLSLVRRRKWWIVIPAVLCIAGAAGLAITLPRVYRSAATITVSSPALSADLLKQAGPLSRDERIRAISQQLLSRSVLEQIVRDEHLAPDGNVDAAVDRLLQPNRIKVEPTELLKQVARAGQQLDAFLLSYAARTPGEAQRVADTIARVFVEASSRSREARAEDTSAFIATQLAASKDRLDQIEERLRKAKESYMGRLPEQTQSNLSIAAGTRQQLESTAIALRGEQDRLSMIEGQIDGMKQGAGDVTLPGRPAVSSAEARVLLSQRELASARGHVHRETPGNTAPSGGPRRGEARCRRRT